MTPHRLRRFLRLTLVTAIALTAAWAVAATGGPPTHDAMSFDPYPAREIPTSCHDVFRPGLAEFRRMIMTQVGGRDSGVFACRPIEGKTTLSYHADSRAWDWRMNAGDAADRERVGMVLSWLLRTEHGVAQANARHLGIGEIIWNHEIVTLWGDDPAPACHHELDRMSCLRPYDGINPHIDHVHFSFSVSGADDTTAWSTSRTVTPWWHLTNLPPSSAIPPFAFGPRDAVPLAGDWDGDGDDTLGFYDPRQRRFHVRNTLSTGPADLVTAVIGPFGAIPFAGDWDGDARDEFGFYVPTKQEFHFVDRNGAPMRPPVIFGRFDDLPVIGNWDTGDRADEIGVYRPSDGTFHRQLGSGATLTTLFGGRRDVPLAGYFDGEPGEDVAVFRPSDHRFTLLPSTGPELVMYGQGSVFELVGDWDGHGRSGLGVAVMPVAR